MGFFYLMTVDFSQYFFQILCFKAFEFVIFPELQAKHNISLCRKEKDRAKSFSALCTYYFNGLYIPSFMSCLGEVPSSLLLQKLFQTFIQSSCPPIFDLLLLHPLLLYSLFKVGNINAVIIQALRAPQHCTVDNSYFVLFSVPFQHLSCFSDNCCIMSWLDNKVNSKLL